ASGPPQRNPSILSRFRHTSFSRKLATASWRVVLLSFFLTEPAVAQTMLYAGTVTNYGASSAPGTQGITGSLGWNAKADQPTYGMLAIGSPLGGSGAAAYVAWSDTVVLGSISVEGDTIYWLGIASGDDLVGEYYVNGGRF